MIKITIIHNNGTQEHINIDRFRQIIIEDVKDGVVPAEDLVINDQIKKAPEHD